MSVGSKVRARPLRVAIDARLRHGESGGVESVTVGLAEGLSALEGEDEYFFLTLRGEDDWIRPHLTGRARPLPVPGAARHRLRQVRVAAEKAIPGVASGYRRMRPSTGERVNSPPASDGAIERAGMDVMHFLHQSGFRTTVPSIYHPHDLQHRHLPELFTAEQHAFRERWYGELCQQAAMIAVASSWTRQDVIDELGVPAEKVHVVPWAPPLDVVGLSIDAEELSRTADRFDLPPRFLLYPAQTWPHKNHIALVRAIGLIRHRHGLSVPLVLTGKRNATAGPIDAAIRGQGIGDLVTWTDFIQPRALAAVYRLSTIVVIPSKFEAASGPLWEAFAAGVPVACSRVTSLPEQSGDAALLFDPDEPDQIAASILRLWTDDDLGATLVARGRKRVSEFTWRRTALTFRAHYRRLALRTLSRDDVQLMNASPGL